MGLLHSRMRLCSMWLVTAWCFTSVLFAGCVLYLRKSAVFLFPALILIAAQNFLATIWPLVEILRSLVVVYVNHHNKDYLSKTPCDWLCGDDAAFVRLLWPLLMLNLLSTTSLGMCIFLATLCIVLHPSICLFVQFVLTAYNPRWLQCIKFRLVDRNLMTNVTFKFHHCYQVKKWNVTSHETGTQNLSWSYTKAICTIHFCFWFQKSLFVP